MSLQKITLLVVLVLVSLGLGGKLAWDDYQQDRAARKMLEIMRILDDLRLPKDALMVGNTMTSTNEYAASAWRHYRVKTDLSDLKQNFEAQLEKTGFAFDDEGRSYSGPQYYYRKGEFEVRLLFIQNPKEEANFALSANWYGLDR